MWTSNVAARSLTDFPSSSRRRTNCVCSGLSFRGEEDEVVGAVPLLDHVQPIIDLAAQRLAVKISAEEDRLDRLAEFDKLTPRDLRALTPLIWEHVNPYGRFELDMNARLSLL